MIRPINNFAARFGITISLNENLIVNKRGQYFLLSESIKLPSIDFLYAGIYLGRSKEGDFLPSFSLLDIIAKKEANRIIVDRKTEWLFICGRDVFKRGIRRIFGSKEEDAYVLVLNSHGECLGFGRIIEDLNKRTEDPAVENMLDIGDFLRRERAL